MCAKIRRLSLSFPTLSSLLFVCKTKCNAMRESSYESVQRMFMINSLCVLSFLLCLSILSPLHCKICQPSKKKSHSREQELQTFYSERTKCAIWLLHVASCDHHATVASMRSLPVWMDGWSAEDCTFPSSFAWYACNNSWHRAGSNLQTVSNRSEQCAPNHVGLSLVILYVAHTDTQSHLLSHTHVTTWCMWVWIKAAVHIR